MTSTPEPSAQALDTFANQDWSSWAGLPSGLTLDAIKARFPQLPDAHGDAAIGVERVLTRFKTLQVEGLGKPARVWYRDGEVVLLEVRYPSAGLDEFSGWFGEPAAKLDYYQRTVRYAESAFVYPEKGVAVLYNPSRSATIRLYLFAPTTAREYEARLHHPIEAARRLPRRR